MWHFAFGKCQLMKPGLSGISLISSAYGTTSSNLATGIKAIPTFLGHDKVATTISIVMCGCQNVYRAGLSARLVMTLNAWAGGWRRRQCNPVVETQRSPVGYQQSSRVMNQKLNGRMPASSCLDGPSQERMIGRTSERIKRQAGKCIGQTINDSFGPAVHRIGLAIPEFALLGKVGPKTGLLGTKHDKGSRISWNPITSFGIEAAKDLQRVLSGHLVDVIVNVSQNEVSAPSGSFL